MLTALRLGTRIALLASSAVCLFGSVSVLAQAHISAGLADRLATMAPQQTVRVYALMDYQADAAKPKGQASARAEAQERRADFVVDYLKAEHTRSQAALVEALRATEGVSRIEARWLVNLVGFDATPAAIARAAREPGVRSLALELPWVFESAVTSALAVTMPDAAEVGLRRINAPAMWKRGYTGFGGVALAADTGVDPYHPALNHKYAGHAGHGLPWFVNGVSEAPGDCGDHGTHVTGTMLGLDRVTNDTIGVAPDAHWIGGAVLCGYGLSDNLKVLEWALDPGAFGGTSADRPIVINNSWYDPGVGEYECTSRNPYPLVLDNLRAAGVAVVWSVGNDGPGPASVTPPHSYNASVTNAFTVGAVDGNDGRLPIAKFSSRGPGACARGSEALDIKPEVAAPGVDVRSAVPGGGYALKSGTSMAAPHTAGAVLLLHEAFPELDGDRLLGALYYSARDLGEDGEDNAYGRGIIDVDAAYRYLVRAGHAPAEPRRPDVMLNVVASGGTLRQCAGPLRLTLALANPGTEAVSTIKYELSGLTDDPLVLHADVAVAPGAVGELVLRPEAPAEGTRVLGFRILEINGRPADRRLDLGATWRLELSRSPPPTLALDRPDSTLCMGSPVELSLRSALPDPAVTHFSADPNVRVVPPRASQRFVLPRLGRDTTLYGINEYRRSGGPRYPAEGGELVFADASAGGLRFRALGDGIVRALTVNQLTPGRLFLELRLAENLEIVGRYTRVTPAGVNRLATFLEIKAGVEYVLVANGDPKLAYRTEVSSESATLPEFIDFGAVVSETPAQAAGSGYFFDWELGYADGCAAVPVTLRPDEGRTATARELLVEGSEVSVGKPFVARDVKFPYGSAYRWTFDERAIDAAGEVAEVTPTATGEYLLRMSTVDERRCASDDEVLVTVSESSSSTEEVTTSSEVLLRPNPSSVAFALGGATERVVLTEVFDAAGRLVKSFPVLRSQYPVADLPTGVYTVRVTYRDGVQRALALEVRH